MTVAAYSRCQISYIRTLRVFDVVWEIWKDLVGRKWQVANDCSGYCLWYGSFLCVQEEWGNKTKLSQKTTNNLLY